MKAPIGHQGLPIQGLPTNRLSVVGAGVVILLLGA